MVALHGSSNSSYRQAIFEHLANTLAPLGAAVLSFERAPWPSDDVDIPYDVQADGAVAAYEVLKSYYDVPTGVWGVSQGTWVAALAGQRLPDTAFMLLLGCAGVSPAEQMRHATIESVRRAGYDEEAVAGAVEIRDQVAELLRGKVDRAAVDELLRRQADQPWFDLAGIPVDLGEELPVWHEIDFASEPLYATVTCPVLLMHGEHEANLPVPETLEVWRRAAATSGNTQVDSVRIPGVGHWPGTPDRSLEGISPAYTATLQNWFTR
ncbi:alpha/beta hydrolase [Kribbella qitaiheensis]|uniref:Alpha/beta hydrolase n=1 Tax=Kribbella qitaiheensis TaxID=1544730 RepID=A0A7G6X060_9ACTN|nr:alpha/beta hydrolase [Kribbella qitaiheensis]QNE19625.1 alpha/beta hydrolase [Kribbella qitaiheensis]